MLCIERVRTRVRRVVEGFKSRVGVLVPAAPAAHRRNVPSHFFLLVLFVVFGIVILLHTRFRWGLVAVPSGRNLRLPVGIA